MNNKTNGNGGMSGFAHVAFCFLALLPLCLSSCGDWLDVRGENTQKEADQFDSYKGFRTALTGCYMLMGGRDCYGEKLTMTDVENLASLWREESTSSSSTLANDLTHHKYAEDEVRKAVNSMYDGLFTIISSANVILKNIAEKGGNITDSKARAVIEGEAYAIRAYCQFDLLRLFGQVPGGVRQVSLPYSYTTGIGELPAYYAFDDYVARLESDIAKAESLLKDNDPVFGQTFSQLNSVSSSVQDDFLYYRQSRLNYWAVRALHARMSLYVGKTVEAHDIAMEIIGARGADGDRLVALSGVGDLRDGYNGLPSECLFYLSKYDVNEYANDLLRGGRTGTELSASGLTYVISSDQLVDLYASIPGATASHNRYINWWNRNSKDNFGNMVPALKKYWYSTSATDKSYDANTLMTKLQVIPMLRLSEIYLIAMETSNSLDEVLSLYASYMTACEYTLYTPFTSLEQARKEVLNEYRRELFGEGQMFFAYKRNNSGSMLWNKDNITEDDYIIPLPATEYDPATLNK